MLPHPSTWWGQQNRGWGIYNIDVFLYMMVSIIYVLNLPFSGTIFGNILRCRIQYFEVECVAFKKCVSSQLKQGKWHFDCVRIMDLLLKCIFRVSQLVCFFSAIPDRSVVCQQGFFKSNFGNSLAQLSVLCSALGTYS